MPEVLFLLAICCCTASTGYSRIFLLCCQVFEVNEVEKNECFGYLFVLSCLEYEKCLKDAIKKL